jgi:hypothetical protein
MDEDSHRRNDYSAWDYQLMGEDSSGGMVIPLRITSSRTLDQLGKIKFHEKSCDR